LVFAGALHALPGPTLKIQAKQMGMPAWFLLCAGLLMLGSGVLYFLMPAVGLYAVALSMGGAVATAAKMPDVMHRPGGLVFSNATLGAALWVVYKETGEFPVVTSLALCAVSYAFGVAGRVFVPANPLAIKLLGWLAAAEKEGAKKDESEKPKDEAKAGADGEKTTPTETAAAGAKKKEESGGARKRVSSPAPARKE